MLYRFDELTDKARDAALDLYWQSCLNDIHADYYTERFCDIAAALLSSVSDYFYNLNGTRLAFDYPGLTHIVSFITTYSAHGLVSADVDPQSCFAGLEWELDAARHGVPLDDIYWTFVMPDPYAIGFKTPPTAKHFALCVHTAAGKIDDLAASRPSFDDFISGVQDEFQHLAETAGYFMIEDCRTYALDGVVELIAPGLNSLGPVFNADGSVYDGSVFDGSVADTSSRKAGGLRELLLR